LLKIKNFLKSNKILKEIDQLSNSDLDKIIHKSLNFGREEERKKNIKNEKTEKGIEEI